MMPGLDGTGPMGMGPMTGGARGWCNPYGPMYSPWRTGVWGAPAWGAPAPRYGYGWGYAPRYGYGWGYAPGLYWRRGLGLGPCGGGMAWGRGRGFGMGRGWAYRPWW